MRDDDILRGTEYWKYKHRWLACLWHGRAFPRADRMICFVGRGGDWLCTVAPIVILCGKSHCTAKYPADGKKRRRMTDKVSDIIAGCVLVGALCVFLATQLEALYEYWKRRKE
jgi:hypothetical protein